MNDRVRSCESSTDYISVRDGVDDDSPLLGAYCGSVRDAATITSSADTLSIELVADEKKQRQGFSAQFSFIDDGRDPLSPLLPPSGGLVVDGASTTHTARPQFGGRSCTFSLVSLQPNSIKLSWSQTGPKLVADLQRAGIWPII